jgi:hypothetical protein
MARYKTSATVISAAVLVACTPPTYYGDLDNERHVERIICRNVAPLGSNIRRETCRLDRQLTFQERKAILRQGYREPGFIPPSQQSTALGSAGGRGVNSTHIVTRVGATTTYCVPARN